VIVDYHMDLRDADEVADHTLDAINAYVEAAAAHGVAETGISEHPSASARRRTCSGLRRASSAAASTSTCTWTSSSRRSGEASR
jgi:predicted urease superfamily metal-dependent hydrolase